MRAATFDDWATIPDYRRDFGALAKELGTPRYSSAVVIGTLDIQVYSWWMTFHRGYSFLPEAFSTTLPDSEIEERLIQFGRI